jgi:hypothetical protein
MASLEAPLSAAKIGTWIGFVFASQEGVPQDSVQQDGTLQFGASEVNAS